MRGYDDDGRPVRDITDKCAWADPKIPEDFDSRISQITHMWAAMREAFEALFAEVAGRADEEPMEDCQTPWREAAVSAHDAHDLIQDAEYVMDEANDAVQEMYEHIAKARRSDTQAEAGGGA